METNVSKPQHPYGEELRQLEGESEALAQLEGEGQQLRTALALALQGVEQERAFLARCDSPSELLTITDAEIEECQRKHRGLLREVGQAEKGLAEFTAAHPDLKSHREALAQRRERLSRDITRFEWQQRYFDAASQIQAALLALCALHQEKVALSRIHGLGHSLAYLGIPVDDLPNAPVTKETIERAFQFERSFFLGEPAQDFQTERALRLAREHGIFPARLAVTWR